MKQKLLAWATRFDALARRERSMVAVGVLAVIAMLGYNFLFEPEMLRGATLAKRIAQVTGELAAIEAQLVVTQTQIKDPDAGNRAALLQGRKELAALDLKLRTLESSLVPPEKMQFILESLLSKNHNLELLDLRTIPPTTLTERAADAGAAAAPQPSDKKADGKVAAPVPALSEKNESNVYKHGVEIRIAGSYNDLLMYLATIEHMPQRIIWNRIILTAEQYPRNVLTLTVYTLSLDKQWLVV